MQGNTLVVLTAGIDHTCRLPPGMLAGQLQHTPKPESQFREPAEPSKVTTGSGAYCTSGHMPSSILANPACNANDQHCIYLLWTTLLLQWSRPRSKIVWHLGCAALLPAESLLHKHHGQHNLSLLADFGMWGWMTFVQADCSWVS